MFPLNGCNHVALYKARQRDFEAASEKHWLIRTATQSEVVSSLRQRIGSLLIELGQKVAQEPQQDVRLVLSARN